MHAQEALAQMGITQTRTLAPAFPYPAYDLASRTQVIVTAYEDALWARLADGSRALVADLTTLPELAQPEWMLDALRQAADLADLYDTQAGALERTNESTHCELCNAPLDDYHIVTDPDTGALTTICGDCYADGPDEPAAWAFTPREV